MATVAYYLKVFTAILVLINPIGAVPLFLSLTPAYTPEESRRAARRAAFGTTLIMLGALFAGTAILQLFGISLAAFRVAGGLLILTMALEMMRATTSRTRQTPEEATEAAEKPDIAVVPMAIPMLAGPGSISALILYAQERPSLLNYAVMSAIAVVVGLLAWCALRLAGPIGRKLGRTGINLLTRIMGILLAAIAVELMTGGIAQLLPALSIK